MHNPLILQEDRVQAISHMNALADSTKGDPVMVSSFLLFSFASPILVGLIYFLNRTCDAYHC